jgi:hypothetical protein
MDIREIRQADIPSLFEVRVQTHENRLTRDESIEREFRGVERPKFSLYLNIPHPGGA